MLCFIIVLNGVTISAGPVKLLAPAVQLTTCETHPQILLKIAAGTFLFEYRTRAVGSYRVYVRARCPCVHVIFSRCFQISARLICRAVEQQSAGEQLVIIRLGHLLQHTIIKYYHFVLVLA